MEANMQLAFWFAVRYLQALASGGMAIFFFGGPLWVAAGLGLHALWGMDHITALATGFFATTAAIVTPVAILSFAICPKSVLPGND